MFYCPFFFSFRSFVFDLLASLHSHVFLFIHSLSSWLASSHALRHEPSPSLSVMSCPFSLVGRSTRREVDEVRVGASRNGEARLDAPSFLLLSNRQPPDLCLHLNALPPFPLFHDGLRHRLQDLLVKGEEPARILFVSGLNVESRHLIPRLL